MGVPLAEPDCNLVKVWPLLVATTITVDFTDGFKQLWQSS